MGFSEEQIRRYSRHLLLKEVGGKGQRRLLEASAIVIGAGGLGCPAALYLAAAGVGNITVVDDDTVDLSNLQRQVLYTEADLGQPKAEVAAAALRRSNPEIRVTALTRRVTAANAREVLGGQDVVLEGSDSPGTKFAVNDAAVALGLPLVVGGVVRFQGQVLAVRPGVSACYRCIFEAPPSVEAENCAAAGVLGAAAGVVGALMAVEAQKLLLGIGRTPSPMQVLDLLEGTSRAVSWPRRTDCAACAGVKAR